LRLLREAPSATVIDSITAVANEECLVILGRIARTRPDSADAALAALDTIGSSRAVKIAAASGDHRLMARLLLDRKPASWAIPVTAAPKSEPRR